MPKRMGIGPPATKFSAAPVILFHDRSSSCASHHNGRGPFVKQKWAVQKKILVRLVSIMMPFCIFVVLANVAMRISSSLVNIAQRKTLQVADTNLNFGIELEMMSHGQDVLGVIVDYMKKHAKVDVKNMMMEELDVAKRQTDVWKLMDEDTIGCDGKPGCTTFELVSPVLTGREGLSEFRTVVGDVNALITVKVNDSMGYHVHVSSQDLNHDALIRLSQTFIKHEDAMDVLMLPCRRTGSHMSNYNVRSNKLAVGGPEVTNKQRHDKIAECASTKNLVELMNPEGKMYKLNLINLLGTRRTVEFRHHHATMDSEQLINWVLFCIQMVNNAVIGSDPSPFPESATINDQFDSLFENVIMEGSLHTFYVNQRLLYQIDGDDGNRVPRVTSMRCGRWRMTGCTQW